MASFQDHRIERDGVSLHARVEGRPGAPWVAFSNSLLTDLTLWDHAAQALAGRYRVLRYDQRGHGGSSVPPAPCGFDALADDMAAVMDAVGAGEAAVVGVSMGAATVLNLAIRHPARVSRLMGCDGQARSPASNHAAWAERVAMARAEGMDRYAEATLRRWFTPASVAAGIPAIATLRRMISNTPLEGFAAGAAALQSYDIGAGLGGIRCPVLLLAGEADGAMPQTMQALAGEIPGARFEVLPRAGHLPMAEQPEAFQAALERFLES